MTETRIGVIGLGYVGLPLALAFAEKYQVIGFDINAARVEALNEGNDATGEVDTLLLKSLLDTNALSLTDDSKGLNNCNVYIVTVPTPIDRFKRPDLSPLLSATRLIGEVIGKGDCVIFESTVYPGCTEEECVPLLEKISGLVYNQDFFCGYSPERINPGDKINTFKNIKKVTSGSDPKTSIFVDDLYKSVVEAGTHLAPSIKVAEASKAIENAQRDINISFMNELALIFDRMGIDTSDVLDAAASKWNFIKFKPGLVGGHCIGVDPYYLVHKAQTLGYHPEVIMSGRKVNDNMGIFIANKLVKMLLKKGGKVEGAKALILGVTFKENCPDVRNSRVSDIYVELAQFGMHVDVYDPHADKATVKKEYNISLKNSLQDNTRYDVIVLAVSHKEFLAINFDSLKNSSSSIIFDTKSFLDREIVDARL